ncbi:MAG: hypothetical protein JKY48_20760, partial [Flavobacteriales bacterium]|nr:hypothetical protein [Flavobacteriales bacterium]
MQIKFIPQKNKAASVFTFLLVLLLVFPSIIEAQTPQASKNYVIEKVYDDAGNVISYIQVYKDKLGRNEQVQQKDLEENNVIVQQTVFDRYGRSSLQTLPAPAYKTETNTFLPNFITDPSNQTFNSADFDHHPSSQDAYGEVYNPKVVSNLTKGSLGWYYSNNNTEEAYVPASVFPYTRQHIRDDYTNAVSITSSAGFDLRMGSGNERRIIFKHPSHDLEHILGVGNKYYKSVLIDEEGLEQVSYVDAEGKLVAQCNTVEYEERCIPRVQDHFLNTMKKKVDLHVPKASVLTIEKV